MFKRIIKINDSVLYIIYCPEKDENENKIIFMNINIFNKVQNENNEDNINSNSNSLPINNN